MKKWLAFALSVLILAAVHEGTHALVAAGYGEFSSARFVPPGIEIIFTTPLEEREGLQRVFIAGGANVSTIGLGYLLLSFRHRLATVHSLMVRGTFYYTTFLALVMDPLNLSIGPFLYGGDLGGIAMGLFVPPILLQLVFGILLVVNRELVAQVLLPAYGVVTNHLLVRPWFKLGSHTGNRRPAV